MVFMKEKKKMNFNMKGYLLPLYILLSLLFILWSAYSYFSSFVYGSGVQAGGTQVVNAIVVEATKGCNAIPVTSGGTTVQLINVACLQQAAPAEDAMEKEEAAQ